MAQEDPSELLSRTTRAVSASLSHLETCIDRASQELEASEKYDTKLGSHLAYLAEHLTTVLNGVRQLERHDRDAVKRMSPEEMDQLVADYIDELDVDRRAALRRKLDDADRGEGVL